MLSFLFSKMFYVTGECHRFLQRRLALNNYRGGGGRNGIGRREKWPKQSWEEGEIGRKVGRREKKKSKRLGRREKLAQKVGRREIYPLFHPPLIIRSSTLTMCPSTVNTHTDQLYIAKLKFLKENSSKTSFFCVQNSELLS